MVVKSEVGKEKLYIQAGNSGVSGELGELIINCINDKNEEYGVVIQDRKTLLEILRLVKEALPTR